MDDIELRARIVADLRVRHYVEMTLTAEEERLADDLVIAWVDQVMDAFERVTEATAPSRCPECHGTRMVAQTPGVGSDGYYECESCRAPSEEKP